MLIHKMQLPMDTLDVKKLNYLLYQLQKPRHIF